MKKSKRCFNVWTITCCILFLVGAGLYFAGKEIGDYLIFFTWPTAAIALIFGESIRKDKIRWEETVKIMILPLIVVIVVILLELLKKDTNQAVVVLGTGVLILCVWIILLGIMANKEKISEVTGYGQENTGC